MLVFWPDPFRSHYRYNNNLNNINNTYQQRLFIVSRHFQSFVRCVEFYRHADPCSTFLVDLFPVFPTPLRHDIGANRRMQTSPGLDDTCKTERRTISNKKVAKTKLDRWSNSIYIEWKTERTWNRHKMMAKQLWLCTRPDQTHLGKPCSTFAFGAAVVYRVRFLGMVRCLE